MTPVSRRRWQARSARCTPSSPPPAAAAAAAAARPLLPPATTRAGRAEHRPGHLISVIPASLALARRREVVTSGMAFRRAAGADDIWVAGQLVADEPEGSPTLGLILVG